jgi:hypothetical protein
MSPGLRIRLWAAFREAARREPPGSPHIARFRALAGLLEYGAGMPALAASLYRLTSP